MNHAQPSNQGKLVRHFKKYRLRLFKRFKNVNAVVISLSVLEDSGVHAWHGMHKRGHAINIPRDGVVYT